MENIRSLTVLAENMRRLRKIKHLTQEELAYRTGLHPYSIGLIERKVKAPSLRSVEKISRALDVSVAELVSVPVEKNAGDARVKEMAHVLKRFSGKQADALLETFKTLAETFPAVGQTSKMKAAEGESAWVTKKSDAKKKKEKKA